MMIGEPWIKDDPFFSASDTFSAANFAAGATAGVVVNVALGVIVKVPLGVVV
jgi:hypothetical protein